MDTLTLLGTAVALGMDAFAVAICVAASLARLTARHVFRLSWHFGLFQSLMTICGWVGGAALSTFMSGANYWIAFGILSLLGLNMIRQSLHPECRIEGHDPTRGWSLIGFSVATSIDALAVGVSLQPDRLFDMGSRRGHRPCCYSHDFCRDENRQASGDSSWTVGGAIRRDRAHCDRSQGPR